MSVINVSAGNEAVLVLADAVANANVATGAVTGLIVPQMQDITINNSTGIFRFKTLDNTAESAVTTPATNQISLNAVVDATSFFVAGNSPAADKLIEDGLFGASKAKTRVYFQVAFDGRDSGSKIFTGSGFISGLAPTVNMDSPVWITPVTIEVDGDFTESAVA